MMATDYEKQTKESDPNLYPARMSDEHVAKMCPCVMMTFEFDFHRRDVVEYSRRLHAVGKLFALCDLAGYKHGYFMNGEMDGTKRLFDGWAKAFEELVVKK